MGTNWLPDLSAPVGPKYLALLGALREAVQGQVLMAGAQLPTVRELAWQLKITPGTVARAYQLAIQEGLAEAVVGRGTFVAAEPPRPGPKVALQVEAADSHLVDLRTPRLPDLGQGVVFGKALHRLADSVDASWIAYPSQQEEQSLREAVRGWLSDLVLGPLEAEDIALTCGGQHGIATVMQCVLRGDRPVVLAEDLAYPGIRHAARLMRAEVVGVEIDDQGMRPEAFEAACRRHMPQLVCLTTEAQNPTTARMTTARREELARIARAQNVFVLEDDCYTVSEGRLPAFRAHAPERTFYIGSLSKTVSPALRVGWVLCPSGMGDAGRLTVQHGFFALSRPVTALAEELLRSGEAHRLREKLRVELGERLETMVNLLGAHPLAWQPGLPFAWLTLPQGWRASTFARAAEAEGVLVRTADEFALVHARAPNAIRMAVVGDISRARYEAGLQVLAHLLRHPPADLPI